MTLSITNLCSESYNAEYLVSLVVVLDIIMLKVIILSVVMQNVFMLSVVSLAPSHRRIVGRQSN